MTKIDKTSSMSKRAGNFGLISDEWREKMMGKYFAQMIGHT